MTHTSRHALSLLELLAVVAILGVVAALTLPRVVGSTEEADRTACFVQKGDIELQVQLWSRNKNTLPAINLSDIRADVSYFPEGLPTCPVDGTAYTIDSNGHVVAHTH